MDSEIINIPLSRDEVENLPAQLVERIFALETPQTHEVSESALRSAVSRMLDASDVQILIVRTPRQSISIAIRKTMNAVVSMFDTRTKAVSERNIQTLCDLYLEGEARPEVETKIELDNALLRAAYLKSTPTFSSADVRSGCTRKPLNKSEPASRWKREGRVFAIKDGGVDEFPVFQFEDGDPKPIVKSILKQLPDNMSAWQIAFWFDSPNGWLGGDSPAERLNDEGDVLNAALREHDEILG